MKKYLLFILFLLIPFMVKAQDVKIKEVVLVDKTEGIEAEEKPEFENLKINFNLNFSKVDEFVKYKVIVENSADKDYEIDDTTSFSDGEYIKYEFSYDGEKIVKSKGTKEFFITISYNKRVPLSEYVDGKFKEKNSMTINLSNETEEKNPYTATLPYIVVILAIISIILFVIAFKMKRSLMLTIAILFFMPAVIFALEKISIAIEANIEIEPRTETLKIVDYNCSANNTETDLTFGYTDGMVWTDLQNTEFANISNYEHDTLIEMIDDNDVTFYPNEYDACVAEVEYQEWYSNMTPEDREKYEAYNNNRSRCRQEYGEHVSKTDEIKPREIGYYYYGCYR